jgi:hypothetical protein
MSSNRTVWEASSLNETATTAVVELESALGPDEFASLREAGTVKPYQVVVKELLAQLWIHPSTPRSAGRALFASGC